MLTAVELAENYCALAVAILKSVTPERAFEEMDRGPAIKNRMEITREDVMDMYTLNEQGVTCREIAEMYGMKLGAVHRRVWKIRNEMQASGQV